jgi:hypothetical protein
VDEGTIRQDGSTAEVTSAYESAMSSAERATPGREETAAYKARFQRWEILEEAGEGQHAVYSFGPLRVRFYIDVYEAVQHGHHGIALYNSERQLMWAWAADDISLKPGLHALTYEFPFLPLRPGPYSWQVTLWADQNLMDMWDSIPDMIIATPNQQHARDEWNGILNVPSTFSVTAMEGHAIES